MLFFENKFLKFIFALFGFIIVSCRKGKGAICNDGWRSHSTGSGTCSWHGGIDHYVDPNEIDVGSTAMLIVFFVLIVVVLRAINKSNK